MHHFRAHYVFSLFLGGLISACTPSSPEASEPKPTASQGGVIVAAPTSSDSGSSSKKPEIKRPRPTPVKRDAGAECRAPSEARCSTCCDLDGDKCTIRSWKGLGASPDLEPWYNSVKTADSCPVACRPCASCSARAEKSAKAFLEKKRSDCDCATEKIGNDPCFTPATCGCYCSREKGLATACPELFAGP